MDNGDPDLTVLLRDLSRELRRIQREVEPERRFRPPKPGELSQFASEVAIPALILMLKFQIQALELLRRTIRLADGRDPHGGGNAGPSIHQRVEKLGQATVAEIDGVLDELQKAIEGQPQSDRAQRHLENARKLRERIENELDTPNSDGVSEIETAKSVEIDIEAELESLKNDIDSPVQDESHADDDDHPRDDSSNSDTD